jgi:hypothetical protein
MATLADVKKSAKGWSVTLEGCGEAGAAGSYLWPNGVPNGVTITLLIAVTEPSQVGQFEISGLTFEALQAMEPAAAKRITDESVMTSDNDGSGGSYPASGGTGDDSGASDVDVHLDEQTKEEVGEWVKSALEGTHRLADVAEVAEHLTNAVSHLTDASAAAEEAASSAVGEAAGALAGGLEVVNSVLGPIGAVTLVVLVGSEIVDAFKSEKRDEEIQGFCYGVMWEALNEPDRLPRFVPGMSYSADELQSAFVQGVEDGREKAKDVKVRNRIILAVASLGLRTGFGNLYAAQQVLSAIWRANREPSPSDGDTDFLDWPQPCDRTVLGI